LQKPDNKKCVRCQKEKASSEFNSNASRKDGLSPYCKVCKAMYREEHSEKERVYQRKVYQENIEARRKDSRRRMQLRRAVMKVDVENISLFIMQWEMLCASNAYRCFCCGREKPLQVDHILPVAEGGSDHISNLQSLCASCKRRKGSRTINFRKDPNRGN
jgi:5-methylcytosine-specific restriction endonuclease McrA